MKNYRNKQEKAQKHLIIHIFSYLCNQYDKPRTIKPKEHRRDRRL